MRVLRNSPRKLRGKREDIVNEQEDEEQQQNKPIEVSTINQAVSTQIEQPQTGRYNDSLNDKRACEKTKTC